MVEQIQLDFYASFMCVVMTCLLGYLVVSRSKILQEYNIPEAVVGGIIIAVVVLLFRTYLSIEVVFDDSIRNPLMLSFFVCIGLGADFASLKKGGAVLLKFLVVVSGMIVVQNIVGVGTMWAMGYDAVVGLLGGSISLSGGHGTASAWSSVLSKEPYGLSSAFELSIACATFGLVAGGLIGGPVAKYLIKKHKIKLQSQNDTSYLYGFEEPKTERLITATSFVKSLSLIAMSLFVGTNIAEFLSGSSFTLPTFVWCLLVGVVLRNLLGTLKIHQVFDREVSVIGNVSLMLFLALALMSINLWQLVALALPIMLLLTLQIVSLVLYVIFVTFRVMGKDYDAVVICAGHCGFGLGATPTAIANMQAISQHYGASHIAFIVVPMVGAFFIDLINATIIQGFLIFLTF